ncbi:hypothetical protein ZIOFF_037172 [Zingiber officinale]|uniref:Response regulatory domain-containing protein n=1 Tax=Zingiber officinale TaxID=94328 RepID=A0A8J5GJB5_ZINOF|nr:hypothetical protein ZIOFF_037172 [Zingiber officinale]
MEPNVNMIITDNWMPKMTGYGLLKRIKESSKMRGIPVIIICLEEEVEDFLLKHVRPSDAAGEGRGG